MAIDSLISQLAAQSLSEPNSVLGKAYQQLLDGTSNANTQNIEPFQAFFYNLFSAWLPGIIGYLSNSAKNFILNPNINQISNSSNNSQDLSYLLKELANTIYGISLELLLLLFILSIWRYWTRSAWHGSGNAMAAIGRLIFTIAIITAWPTIYGFEIELSNEMISVVFSNAADQLHLFDLLMSSIFTASVAAGSIGTISGLATTAGNPYAWMIGTAIANLASYITLLVVSILAIILIYELVYIIALKAMQTALLVAQYVFAPIFLVFFATPSTENIAVNYIRSFVEVSLWSFIWIGLLKILFILLYSSFNPWGKAITVLGILQIMMQVPRFLAQARISNISSVVNPHFFTQPLSAKAFQYRDNIIKNASALKTGITSIFGNKENNTNKNIHVEVIDPMNFSFSQNNSKNNAPEFSRSKENIPPKLSPNNLKKIGYVNQTSLTENPLNKKDLPESKANFIADKSPANELNTPANNPIDKSKYELSSLDSFHNHPYGLNISLVAWQSFARQAALNQASISEPNLDIINTFHSVDCISASSAPIISPIAHLQPTSANSANAGIVSNRSNNSPGRQYLYSPVNKNIKNSAKPKPKNPPQNPSLNHKYSNKHINKQALNTSSQLSTWFSLAYMPGLKLPAPILSNFSPLIHNQNGHFNAQTIWQKYSHSYINKVNLNSPVALKSNIKDPHLLQQNTLPPMPFYQKEPDKNENKMPGNNLILDHGNSPTLVGIPPIYPEADKT